MYGMMVGHLNLAHKLVFKHILDIVFYVKYLINYSTPSYTVLYVIFKHVR